MIEAENLLRTSIRNDCILECNRVLKAIYQQEEQERRREAVRPQEEAEEKICKTTLLEISNACHAHLRKNLTFQTGMSLPGDGDPANAYNKFRPEGICAWEDSGLNFPYHLSYATDTLHD